MNKRKKAVVDHAISLFVEQGIANTSIQDILERASISKGTFYNYFSSKNDCVEAILEQARYDATLMRSGQMIGKDAKDRDVLVEQITVLYLINKSRGLDIIYEEILHSGDKELKKLVLKSRVHELQWLGQRFIEVFGEEIRTHSFEAAVIYYGILQHLTFTGRLMNQQDFKFETVIKNALRYIEKIVGMLIHEQTSVLNTDDLHMFISSFVAIELTRKEVFEQLEQFKRNSDFTKNQQDIMEAVTQELQQQPIRSIVLESLLRTMTNEFSDSEMTLVVKELTSGLWYLMKQQKL